MNKSYRIVWNKARNCQMVVAEFASSRGKGKSAGGAVIGAVGAALLSLLSANSYAQSLPCPSPQGAGDIVINDGRGYSECVLLSPWSLDIIDGVVEKFQ